MKVSMLGAILLLVFVVVSLGYNLAIDITESLKLGIDNYRNKWMVYGGIISFGLFSAYMLVWVLPEKIEQKGTMII